MEEKWMCKSCGQILMPSDRSCRFCGTASNNDIVSKKDDVPKKIQTFYNPSIPFFPYKPRPTQMTIMRDIKEALDSDKHVVIESGTGTGKTIISLASALEHARKAGKKIVYLTRTISQSDQVMKELKAINMINPVSGITLTGRGKSCPLARSNDEWANLPSNILSLMCEEKKGNGAKGKPGSCRYFNRTRVSLDQVREFCMTYFPTSEELDGFCERIGCCPYETKKALIGDMDVVIAPYIHILSEDIRNSFVTNLGGADTKVLLIIDEAHNIVDAAREQESFTIRLSMIENALDECTAVGKRVVGPGLYLEDFIKSVKAAMRQLSTECIPFGKSEARLDQYAVEAIVRAKLNADDQMLKNMVQSLIEAGEDRLDSMGEGNFQTSSLFDLGVLLKKWIETKYDGFIQMIKTNDDGEFLAASCIDPDEVVMFIRGSGCAIHMSGTLSPLDQYRNVMGLPRDTVMKIYPSPFAKENRSVVYVNDVTTRFEDMSKDPTLSTRIERNVAKLCNAVNKNTLVFFPSYKMMNDMRPFLERDIDKSLYWEEAGFQKRTMGSLNLFRKGSNGVFFSVIGGSVAEGIDFPGDELCFAILVGIQFPKPSLELKSMSDMYDSKYGRGTGWKYTYEIPAIRRMRQAIGRLIRTETDRGMAVILDSRISKYKDQLEANLSNDPVKDAETFFKG